MTIAVQDSYTEVTLARIDAALKYRPPVRTERAVPPLPEVPDDVAAQPPA